MKHELLLALGKLPGPASAVYGGGAFNDTKGQRGGDDVQFVAEGAGHARTYVTGRIAKNAAACV